MLSRLGKLAALRAHRRFVAQKKAAARQQLQGRALDPATVVPTIVGAEPLSFKMPPMMEQAFGYRGKLRFVEFSYWPRSPQFGYSDGGDHVPSDGQLWKMFVTHRLIASRPGENRCPTLYGKVEPDAKRQNCREFDRANGDRSAKWHCLLFDRRARQPYLYTRDQKILFFPLTEPEHGDDHTVFVDGLLVSPDRDDYRSAPPAEVAEQLRAWLDSALLNP